MTDAGYDFVERAGAIQAQLEDFALLTAAESYVTAGSGSVGRHSDSRPAMAGTFRLALVPGADDEAFERHVSEEVFEDVGALGLTRITEGFAHELLRATGNPPAGGHETPSAPRPHYLWYVNVSLSTDSGFDFAGNASRVQERVAPFAVLIDVDSYVDV